MFIVLEGSDKTGKTTLGNELSSQLGLPIIKFSQPKGDPYEEYMRFLLTQKEPAILDRFYLGELVYGPIYRNSCGIGDSQRRNLEEMLRMRRAFCIRSYNTERRVIKKFREDNEQFAREEDVKKILDGYDRAVRTSTLEWHDYSYSDKRTRTRLMSAIRPWFVDMIDNLDHLRRMVDLRTKGSFEAKVLIVGDKANVSSYQQSLKLRSVSVPFEGGHSTMGLYDAVKMAALPKSWYAITNSKKLHLGGNATALLDELSLPELEYVVCLGGDSYERTMKYFDRLPLEKRRELRSKLTFLKAPHPSYARRFNRLNKLAEVLSCCHRSP